MKGLIGFVIGELLFVLVVCVPLIILKRYDKE